MKRLAIFFYFGGSALLGYSPAEKAILASNSVALALCIQGYDAHLEQLAREVLIAKKAELKVFHSVGDISLVGIGLSGILAVIAGATNRLSKQSTATYAFETTAIGICCYLLYRGLTCTTQAHKLTDAHEVLELIQRWKKLS